MGIIQYVVFRLPLKFMRLKYYQEKNNEYRSK